MDKQEIDALVERFGAVAPRSRAVDKRRKALKWLNRWGYSTPGILAELLGVDRSAGPRLVQQLAARDLVREVVAGGNWGYWRYGPNRETGKRDRQGPFVVMLTETGKATAIAVDNTLGATWERQVSGIQSIRHNLMTQQVVVQMINLLGFDDYLTEPQLREQSKPGRKQPDAILLKGSEKTAIEIELTPKSTQTGALDRALMAVAQAIADHQFQYAMYLFSSDEHRKTYERAWQRETIPIWKKNGNTWETTSSRGISDAIRASVQFVQSDVLLGDLI